MIITDELLGRIREAARLGKLTKVQLARRFKVSKSSIRRWLALETLPSQRPPRRMSDERKKMIRTRRAAAVTLARRQVTEVRNRVTPVKKLVRSRAVTLRQFPGPYAIAREMQTWSRSTIARDLRAAGLRPYSSGAAPAMTPSHMKYRVTFCRAMLRLPKAKLRTLMFSDEKYFDAQTKRFVRYWDTSPSGLPSGQYVQKGPRVQVLGFISRTHRRLVFLSGTITEKTYKAELAKYKAVLRQHLFQQDNASPHAKLARSNWFKRNHVEVLRWPPYSPDLNVIETVWAIMADKVRRKAPFGEQQIKAFVKQVWAEIDQSTLRDLVDEFVERCHVCVRERGGVVTRTKLLQWRREQEAQRAQAARAAKSRRAPRAPRRVGKAAATRGR